MSGNFKMDKNERAYLRELAKRQLECANLPIMAERAKRWYAHNDLRGGKPLIVVEHNSFAEEILPQSKCHNAEAKEIERQLCMWLANHEMINDDKVIPPYYAVYWDIRCKDFDIDMRVTHAEDRAGRRLGYAVEHIINNLEKDFPKLKPSRYGVDRGRTLKWKTFVEEAIGDILPVVLKNNSLYWHVTPSEKVVRLMGLEGMMYAMADYPETMKALFRFITDDVLSYVRWQEREGLLTCNNGNDFMGSGSYGFSATLPSKTEHVTAKDLWININSQETAAVSPEMYGEFIAPYYSELAAAFGLLYYGCCEPVDGIWQYVREYPNLRKISVSPWCDEERMGDNLRGGAVIYSRKPSPNDIGIVRRFDETAFAGHIARTLRAARDCRLEFIFRDVYTLSGDNSKPGRAVEITRNLIDSMW